MNLCASALRTKRETHFFSSKLASVDATVCKFCGISYLVLDSLRRLEESLAAAEAQLAGSKDATLLEDRIARLEAEKADLAERVEQSRRDRADAASASQEHVRELTAQLAEARGEVRKLLADNSRREQELRAKADEAHRARLDAQSRYFRLQGQIRLLVQAASHIQRELVLLRESATNELDQQRAAMQQASSDVAAACKAVARTAKQAGSLESSLSKAKKKNAGLAKEVEAAKRAVRAATERATAAEEQVATSTSELERSCKRIRHLEGTVERLRAESSHTVQMHTRVAQDAQSQIDEFQKHYTAEIEGLEQELRQRDAQLSDQMDATSAANQQAEQARQRLDVAEQTLQAREAELKRATAALATAQGQLDALSTQDSHASAALEQMRSREAKLLQRQKAIQAKHEEQIRQMQEALDKDRGAAGGQIARLQEEHDKEMRAMRSAAETARLELLADHQSEIQQAVLEAQRDAAARIDALQRRHAEDLETGKMESRVALAHGARADARIGDLERELRAARTEIFALSAANSRLASEQAATAEALREAEARPAIVQADRDPDAEMLEMVEMMEGQLRILAKTVREKDEHVMRLQQTIHKECLEREELSNVVMVLRRELEEALAAREPVRGAAEAIPQEGMVRRARGRGRRRGR